MTRTVGVLTTGRADYGICLAILEAIRNDPSLDLRLLTTGMHLSPEFGLSVSEIEKDGFEIHERVETLLSSDTPGGVVKSMGLTMVGFADVFSRWMPDILLVVGDRFEVQAAVAATVPFGIPVAHVHGGELTEGAMDEQFRHSITKMSHIHFATAKEYANRISQMGEEEWRIFVSGAPGLDSLLRLPVQSREQIGEQFAIDLSKPTLLATYHPVTRSANGGCTEIEPLLSAIQELDIQVIFTCPNADTGGRFIAARIHQFQNEYPKAKLVVNSTQAGYAGLMTHASAMAGNSSSGIIEAPSFGLPVVNVGPRQAGRIRANNVIDVQNNADAILEAFKTALSEDFRLTLRGQANPYGDGQASKEIVSVLKRIELGGRLINKKFVDRNLATSA